MTYEVIHLPFTNSLESLSRQELKVYQEWFLCALRERTAVLTDAVHMTPGFERWSADFSSESLEPLGIWFAQQVSTRPKTHEEIEKARAGLKFEIDIPEYDLTHETLSLAMDVGFYLGRVFTTLHPNLKWIQQLESKRNVDYGQMVIAGFDGVPMNPVRISIVFAYGIADRSKTGHRLKEIYDYWSQRA